ncbi:MAG: hypothetical protein K2V38_03440, partial [Gemmataceae bacterium]|nr:hypothetical protein [Gemmataceae bacterium]
YANDKFDELVLSDWALQDETPTPVPPQQPPAPAQPAFDKVEDILTKFNKNKAAADILGDFVKAGGQVISGPTNMGAKISHPLKPGDKLTITLDPKKLKDDSDAVGALLFELVRWKNQKQFQDEVISKVRAGTITPAEGATKYEELTHEFMKQQQELLQAAVRGGDWTIQTDRLKAILDKYKTFPEFLKYEKESGHYGAMEKQLERLAPKK